MKEMKSEKDTVLVPDSGYKAYECDWLTGVYTREFTEKRINQFLKEQKAGVLIVVDVDDFKQVNDRFGHIIGDRLLNSLASMLKQLTLHNDLVGRVGGDEFVIFMPIQQDEKFVENRCRQIHKRVKELYLNSTPAITLSVTAAGSSYRPGDDYSNLFDRADQQLLVKKSSRRRGRKTGEPMDISDIMCRGVSMDMKCIQEELSEQELAAGAYCQDYETFKSIYRFMERRMQRMDSKSYIILLTLTNEQREFPSLSERDLLMQYLKQQIQDSLRAGDVFTQYSSCQFLVMAADVEKQQADLIAERINTSFYARNVICKDNILLHHCYPLQPAGALK